MNPSNFDKSGSSASPYSGASKLNAPTVKLPSGGGALGSTDGKFSMDSICGAATLSFQVPFSPGRALNPSLSLIYNPQSGGGMFGLGWQLDIPFIQRKTTNQLPLYDDDLDTFIFSGADDLVPALKQDATGQFTQDRNGNFIKDTYDSSDSTCSIMKYQTRIESDFSKIERWTEKASGVVHWRVVSKDNVTSVFGQSANGKISDPVEPLKVFKWFIEFSYDDKGSCIHYNYKPEDGIGILKDRQHNRNRLNGSAKFVNTYLKGISSGNISPYNGGGAAYTGQWMFEMTMDYGEYDPLNAPFNETGLWSYREDAFSEYLAGFEIRNCRICRRLLFYHHFSELPGATAVVRTVNFAYHADNDCGISLLSQIKATGFTKHDDNSYTQQDLAPFEFSYQQHSWNTSLGTIDPGYLTDVSLSFPLKSYSWIDYRNEALPGIFAKQANEWYYKENNGNATFGLSKLLASRPSFNPSGEDGIFMDLQGDGQRQLVYMTGPSKGYFEQQQSTWQKFTVFSDFPSINLNDEEVFFIDLNGDGKKDILCIGDETFYWYSAEGKNGYKHLRQVTKFQDEEAGPVIGIQTVQTKIFTGDMTGDGLSDIIRVRNGEICYWPNMGYGRFGAKITMDLSPLFDIPDQFNMDRILLADVNGTGTTDLLYYNHNNLFIWLNQQGNGFSKAPYILPALPETNKIVDVTTIDILGNGMTSLVFSGRLPGPGGIAPIHYIDLLNSQKPLLLNGFKNNIGNEMQFTYKPSTWYYLKDKSAGRPWVTKLNFVVHCVASVTQYDRIRKTRLVSEYAYHHGYYDLKDKEFRGFGSVTQTDSEALLDNQGPFDQPPVLTKSWFHTGANPERKDLIRLYEAEYYQNKSRPEKTMPQQQFPDNWDELTRHEACRACKGKPLRTEVYANDGTVLAPEPYLVQHYNPAVLYLQPKGANRYPIFLSYQSEAVTYNYERNTANPRVTHQMWLALDNFGNILKQITIAYPCASTSAPVWPEQQQLHAQLIEKSYTNIIATTDDYRLPLSFTECTYDVTGMVPPSNYFELGEVKNTVEQAIQIDYDSLPSAGIQKRIISYRRTQYRGDDGLTILPWGSIASKGLVHQSGEAVINLSLLTKVFQSAMPVIDLQQHLTNAAVGGYVFDTGYFWSNSDSPYYDTGHFYHAVRIVNSFNQTTTITYDAKYTFFVQSITDALNNSMTVVGYNYRTLAAYLIKDSNQNLTAVRFDETCNVIRSFAIGKTEVDKGDQFDQSKVEIKNANDFAGQESSYFLLEWYNQQNEPGFDPDNYQPKPNYIKSRKREQHYLFNPLQPATWLESYVWLDGQHKPILKKVQAEPGAAAHVNTDGSISQVTDTSPALRWLGSGAVLLNNKGNPVQQYEPYYSTDPVFDEPKEIALMGPPKTFTYDPLNRVTRIDFPNGTLARYSWDTWMKTTYDQNDTVLESQWYKDRITAPVPGISMQEIEAAQKTALHNNTPTVEHLDTRGYLFLTEENDGQNILSTKVVYDALGNETAITDPLGRQIATCVYNMIGGVLSSQSLECGQRLSINNAIGKELLAWDALGRQMMYNYDQLARPANVILTANAQSVTVHSFKYGESLAVPDALAGNLYGKLYQQKDQSGVITNRQFDFKNNLLVTDQQLVNDYKNNIDWANPSTVTLDNEIYTGSITYDALNRPVQTILPRQSAELPSSYTQGYNASGLLNTIALSIGGAAPLQLVSNIRYNPQGQLESILLGNNTKSNYIYDQLTLRLSQLTTVRSVSPSPLQALSYTYDPVGNVTAQSDAAKPVIIYDGESVSAANNYTYDAIYRLVTATGRKHAGQTDINPVYPDYNYRNYPFNNSPTIDPNNNQAFRNYKEQYAYDKAGNMLSQNHSAKNSAWNKIFTYGNPNNQLTATVVGSFAAAYDYDLMGNIKSMEHLKTMNYDFQSRLKSIDLGGGGMAYYVYDASGIRIKKVVERQGGIKQVRLYLGHLEVYREINAGGTITTQRNTLHAMQGEHRITSIDTLVVSATGSLSQLIRYQYADQLQSCLTELDDQGLVITQEEYFPFGTTSYSTTDATREVAAKRYRYAAKERDEESGLYYYGIRYLAPWLCRWTSADPTGISDGLNLYAFVHNNPVKMTDRLGGKGEDASQNSSSTEFQNISNSVIERFGSTRGTQIVSTYNTISDTKTGKESSFGDISINQANGEAIKLHYENHHLTETIPAHSGGDGLFIPETTLELPLPGSNNNSGAPASKAQSTLSPAPPTSRDQRDMQANYRRMVANTDTVAAIQRASSITGVPVENLQTLALVESGGNGNIGRNQYGFAGLMQLGRPAVQDVLRRFPEAGRQGVSWDNVTNNVAANALAGAYLWRLNQERMAANHMDATTTNLYFAHQQGFGGMRNLLRVTASNPMAPLLPNQRGNFPSNSGITTQGQFRNYWNNRIPMTEQVIHNSQTIIH